MTLKDWWYWLAPSAKSSGMCAIINPKENKVTDLDLYVQPANRHSSGALGRKNRKERWWDQPVDFLWCQEPESGITIWLVRLLIAWQLSNESWQMLSTTKLMPTMKNTFLKSLITLPTDVWQANGKWTEGRHQRKSTDPATLGPLPSLVWLQSFLHSYQICVSLQCRGFQWACELSWIKGCGVRTSQTGRNGYSHQYFPVFQIKYGDL